MKTACGLFLRTPPLCLKLGNDLFYQNTLIHRIFYALNFLIILMAFSGKYNNITVLGILNSITYSFLSVSNIDMSAAGLCYPLLYIGNNIKRLLKSRIIRGYNCEVSQLSRDLPHLEAPLF